MSLLLAILNHGPAAPALALRAVLRATAPVLALDSGSTLSVEERARFDYVLPNVFYAGLLAAAVAAARSGGFEWVWLWTSDVTSPSPPVTVRTALPVLRRDDAGIYAPAADYSPHPQMRPRGDHSVRPATFVDGFCFAARTTLLETLCADGGAYGYGYGVDIHLGLLAHRRGLRTWVDHGNVVSHPRSTGYSSRAAKLGWKRWRRRLPLSARLFHRLAYSRRLKSERGMRALLALPW